jgi:hypothetical protein
MGSDLMWTWEHVGGRMSYLPIALPVAQAMKFAAMTVVFLVWPAMLRDIRERDSVCADQKERVR